MRLTLRACEIQDVRLSHERNRGTSPRHRVMSGLSKGEAVFPLDDRLPGSRSSQDSILGFTMGDRLGRDEERIGHRATPGSNSCKRISRSLQFVYPIDCAFNSSRSGCPRAGVAMIVACPGHPRVIHSNVSRHDVLRSRSTQRVEK